MWWWGGWMGVFSVGLVIGALATGLSLQGGAPWRWTFLAWVPIPVLLVTIAGLWIADLRTAYESRTVMVIPAVLLTIS